MMRGEAIDGTKISILYLIYKDKISKVRFEIQFHEFRLKYWKNKRNLLFFID